jgi:hypothetical protein
MSLGQSCRWTVTVAFVSFSDPADEQAILGHVGCLAFFRTTFDGETAELEMQPASTFPGTITWAALRSGAMPTICWDGRHVGSVARLGRRHTDTSEPRAAADPHGITKKTSQTPAKPPLQQLRQRVAGPGMRFGGHAACFLVGWLMIQLWAWSSSLASSSRSSAAKLKTQRCQEPNHHLWI